jgi:sugar-specific transcriptional regulator TrmB
MRNKILRMLGLSAAEEKVFEAIREGSTTPLQVHIRTGVSRTAVYNILNNLSKRRLVARYKESGKFYYRLQDSRELSEELYSLKAELLGSMSGRSELAITNDGDLIVHRGIDTVRTTYKELFSRHKHERFVGFQGAEVLPLYKELLGLRYVNSINRTIKDNKMIVEGIIANTWRKSAASNFDDEWLKDYTGRMANIHEIENTYFDHLGEIYIFGETVYLISLADELVIEVTHSHIAKAIKSLIRYVMDHTKTVDINQKVRASFEAKTK